jgi:hypothetical protein
MIIDIYNPKCNPEWLYKEFRRACSEFPIHNFTIVEMTHWITEQNGYAEIYTEEARKLINVWVELGYVTTGSTMFIWNFKKEVE